jgi:hypothetical protein
MWDALSDERVCPLEFLLAFASAVILVSEYLGTHNHILLSQIRDFPFRRLLRRAGLRWKYSTPPPHGSINEFTKEFSFISRGEPKRDNCL